MTRLLGLGCALGVGLIAGCNLDPYVFVHDQDAGGDGDGGGGGGGDGGGDRPDAKPLSDARADAGPDACVPQEERCNGVDDDCDGVADPIDDVPSTASDPANCGSCGHQCDLPNMNGTCEAGACRYSCRSCFHDIDGDSTPPLDETIANGCEYSCCPSNDGDEVCDGFDNDCDNAVDEDFDIFGGDVNNCGGCNRVCTVQHATPTCAPPGVCTYTACDPGYEDILPGVPGCEYLCPDPARPAEICDGIDQDCDGVVDDGNPGGGAPCGTDVGVCEFGSMLCLFGVPTCIGGVRPAAVDPCDNLDNDCNGTTDDGFDKQNDPNHCGPTCMACSLPNAIEGCLGGVCRVASCLPGFINLDGDPFDPDGCEYACTPTGPEICDGNDNDCDGLVDGADSGLVLPSNFCVQTGACAGTTPQCGSTSCDPAVRWRCVYGGLTEHSACGDLVPQELVCDDVDGDCDGFVDDGFDLKGLPCDDGGIGICRGTGVFECDGAGDDLTCVITMPGASPTAEVCDGLDQDCDGVPDDGAPSETVHVVSGAMNYRIFRFEASRPDASASLPGTLEHRPCSKPDVVPWASATWIEANAACAAIGSGWRLCSEAEWQRACEGPSLLRYPYGNAYDADACNGEDYDLDCALPDEDEVLPTGTDYSCPTPLMTCQSGAFAGGTTPTIGAIDMSGNLKEWTSTQVSSSPVAYRIRGGAYDSIAPGLTCDFDFVAGASDFFFPNLGFRCCRTGP